MNFSNKQYCESLIYHQKLGTREVHVGSIPLGNKHPIRIQSMTNTDTNDSQGTIAQIKRIADAGGDYARMTTRTVKEAYNLENIKTRLLQQGYLIPLIADVHFNPKIAEIGASHIEKVRINPGNYAIKYTKQGAHPEKQEAFIRLIEICRANKTALRIGVNHGSLDQRIMDAYGDTPPGMTESALEFIKICETQNFHQIVVSMKSSNTRVMVQANRLLVHKMLRRGSVYPLHLGVTEAGEGEEGRIKSAVGIGALLTDGIGDTIRVSLTEAPEKEIPVARKLVNHARQKSSNTNLPPLTSIPIDPFDYQRRKTTSVAMVGGEYDPVVVGEKPLSGSPAADLIMMNHHELHAHSDTPVIIPYKQWFSANQPEKKYPLFPSISHFLSYPGEKPANSFICASIEALDQLADLKTYHHVVLLLKANAQNPTIEQRRFIFEMMHQGLQIPVIIRGSFQENNLEDLQLKAASDLGLLFIDGLADGLYIENKGSIAEREIINLSYGILQASRSRIYKTEFISCPGCGRTQFNLESTAAKIRKRMGHLKGLKIAVMGCIVNGPGEMADADYGYVGSGQGKITLYRKKQVIKKNIPEDQAVEELEKLIKQYGDWKGS